MKIVDLLTLEAEAYYDDNETEMQRDGIQRTSYVEDYVEKHLEIDRSRR